MNAIYQLLNPDNTISLNRPLAHAVGLMETVVYSALIAKWQYYSDRGKLDPDGWFYSTIADLEESWNMRKTSTISRSRKIRTDCSTRNSRITAGRR